MSKTIVYHAIYRVSQNYITTQMLEMYQVIKSNDHLHIIYISYLHLAQTVDAN